jgi:uncharacterized protein (DUF2235 family)
LCLEEKKMRRLIICADGTWNRPDQKSEGVETPTNVVKMARAIRPVDTKGVTQVAFYHAGVGTHDPSDKLFGGAFGRGLDKNIRDCYRFLVQNYQPGDELYFFGFSRGAYTVRSLAGLVRNSGLLKIQFADQEGEAFTLYRDRSDDAHPNGEASTAFRAKYSYDPVPITCIGVWDTVGALGLPVEFFNLGTHRKYRFHDVTLSSRVQNAFHALAIDERRKPFAPTLWEQPIEDAEKNWLEQAWFSGVHSNVGGGYPDASLSDVALHWMVDRVTDRCGLEIDRSVIAATTKPSPTGVLYDSMKLAYKVIGEFERKIDEIAAVSRARGVNTWEYVHESAKHRLDQLASEKKPYRPRNLSTYLQRTAPTPRVASALLADLRAAWSGKETAPRI